MASNLAEYYASKGQNLPTVTDRTAVASEAGITGYTGTAEQNATLLGYLQKTPNQGGNNVITSDNLTKETPIVPPPAKTDTSTTGLNSDISTLLATTKANASADQATYDKQSADLATAMKGAGDTSTFDNNVIATQGIDSKKAIVDKLSSQIEQEQKNTMDAITNAKANFSGTTGGLSAEINRINTESSNRLANYGIALSSATRDYDTASGIANRLITQNADKIKADIQSRQFVLQQLGTKLGTEQSNAFNLQLKAIDNNTALIKDAISTATAGAKDGSMDGTNAFQAIQDLTSGKISLSEFYKKLGVVGGSDGSNLAGYDITSYATDPKHEANVISIYNTLPSITNVAEADATIKKYAPNSPITGQMVIDASQKYGIDAKVLVSLMQADSSLGTQGLAVKTKNAGNVGNDDAGNTKTFATWGEGVDAVASWLKSHPATNTVKYVIGRNPTADAWVANIEAGKAKLSDITGNPNLKSLVSQGLAVSGANPNTILDTTATSLKELNDMVTNNTGFSGAVGAKGISSFFGLKGTPIAGTNAADFDAKLNQVKNDVIIPNLNLLHGLGRVTDREFQALSSAVTSLSVNTSETQFKSDLKDLTDAINKKLKEAGLNYNGVNLPSDTTGSTYNGITLPN